MSMRAFFTALCCTLICLCAVSHGDAQEEGQRMSVLFTAFDKNDSSVKTLRQEDIRVLEDDVPQNITAFESQAGRPLSLAILIDTSASQEPILPATKAAALAFVSSVLRPHKDRAAVVTFTNEANLEQTLTEDMTALRRAIEKVRFVPPSGYIGGGIVTTKPGKVPMPGATALWDALSATCERVLAQTPADTLRAVVLVTDGVDTASRIQTGKAIERAVRAGVKVYSIGIADSDGEEVARGDLRKISERTGGRAFFPRKLEDLRAAFAQVEQDLVSPYVVSYIPAVRPRHHSFRKLRIELINPELRKQAVRLAYPQGYFDDNESHVASP